MSTGKLTDIKRPTAIFIRGIPGSGKSYIAAGLRQAIGVGQVIMLDPDATDYQSKEYLRHTRALTAEGVDPKLHAYRFLRGRAFDGIADKKIIIWDQPFTNLDIFNTLVGKLQAHAQEHGTSLPVLVVEVEIDSETAKARVAKRKQEGGHGPSDNTLAQRISDYRSFSDQGYDTATVHGGDGAAVSVAAILEALQKLWQKQ